MKACIVGLFSVGLLMGASSGAAADPVTITSGVLSHDSDFGPSGAQLRLVSPEFTLATFIHMDPLPGNLFGPSLQSGESVAFSTRVTSFNDELGTSATGNLQ